MRLAPHTENARNTGTVMAEAFVYDHIRTPRGKGKPNGSLHEVKPIALAAGLIEEIQKRNPSLDPNTVDDVLLGAVSPLGNQGGDTARTASHKAGLPDTLTDRDGVDEVKGVSVRVNRDGRRIIKTTQMVLIYT